MGNSKKRTCFAIMPIGDEDSPIRQRSDEVLEFIITPAVAACGYSKPVRADQIAKDGQITNQVIKAVFESDLVVADLTDRNPNVFYELSYRHAIQRACVQLMHEGQALPFDVSGQRTIFYDLGVKAATKARERLIESIRAVEEDPRDVDSPIKTALAIRGESANESLQTSIEDLISMVGDIRQQINTRARFMLPIRLSSSVDYAFERLMRMSADLLDLGREISDEERTQMVQSIQRSLMTFDEAISFFESGEAGNVRGSRFNPRRLPHSRIETSPEFSQPKKKS